MLKLTPRQAEILASIKRCLEDNGYPPTRAEIAQELVIEGLSVGVIRR